MGSLSSGLHPSLFFSVCMFRTLDLGFEKDLTIILNSLNSAGASRQNVLLSATLTHGKICLCVCLWSFIVAGGDEGFL